MKVTLATIAVVGIANAIAIAEPVQRIGGKKFSVLCGAPGAACPRDVEARDAKLLKPAKFRLLCGPVGGACPRDAMPEALAIALDNAQTSDIVTRDLTEVEKREAKLLKPAKFRLLCGPVGGACPRSAVPEELAEALTEAEIEHQDAVEKRDAKLLKPARFRLLCGPVGGACPRDATPEALAQAIDAAEEQHDIERREAEAKLLRPAKFRLLCGPVGGACPRSAIPEAVAAALEAAENEA